MEQDDFIRRLLRPSASGDIDVILRTHLWVEGELEVIFRLSFERPEHIPERLTFAQKLAFARASGGLPDELVQPVVVLNRIRNKMAHGDADLSVDDGLLQTFASSVRDLSEIHESEDLRMHGDWSDRDWLLRAACSVVALDLRFHRLAYVDWVSKGREAQERLRQAMREALERSESESTS